MNIAKVTKRQKSKIAKWQNSKKIDAFNERVKAFPAIIFDKRPGRKQFEGKCRKLGGKKNERKEVVLERSMRYVCPSYYFNSFDFQTNFEQTANAPNQKPMTWTDFLCSS